MISYRGIGVSQRSYQDTSSEVGVTSVITPLSIRRGAGGEASGGRGCVKKIPTTKEERP